MHHARTKYLVPQESNVQFSDLNPEKDFSKMNHKYNNIADNYRPYNLQKISWFPHQFLNGFFYFGLMC